MDEDNVFDLASLEPLGSGTEQTVPVSGVGAVNCGALDNKGRFLFAWMGKLKRAVPTRGGCACRTTMGVREQCLAD